MRIEGRDAATPWMGRLARRISAVSRFGFDCTMTCRRCDAVCVLLHVRGVDLDDI
jgi:hypothetical protein